MTEDNRCVAHVGFDHRQGQDWQERFYRHARRCGRAATQRVGERQQYPVCWQHAREYEMKGVVP